MKDLIDAAFADHLRVLVHARVAMLDDVCRLADEARRVLAHGGTIFAAGNGGSAADAQHFVAELIGRFNRERTPLRAIALGADLPTVTAISNDFGYEVALTRQVQALVRPNDLFLAISTSGRSPNIVAAARAARAMQCRVAALTGTGGGDLATVADVHLEVPSSDTARVQEVHGLCLHAVAAAVEAAPDEMTGSTESDVS